LRHARPLPASLLRDAQLICLLSDQEASRPAVASRLASFKGIVKGSCKLGRVGEKADVTAGQLDHRPTELLP
jgi:hypothetical protein